MFIFARGVHSNARAGKGFFARRCAVLSARL